MTRINVPLIIPSGGYIRFEGEPNIDIYWDDLLEAQQRIEQLEAAPRPSDTLAELRKRVTEFSLETPLIKKQYDSIQQLREEHETAKRQYEEVKAMKDLDPAEIFRKFGLGGSSG